VKREGERDYATGMRIYDLTLWPLKKGRDKIEGKHQGRGNAGGLQYGEECGGGGGIAGKTGNSSNWAS